MNHPLHYRGETFYQSGLPSLAKGTILQVVRNWAWELPYISCAMVAIGMLIHFGITLINFLAKQGIGVVPGGDKSKRRVARPEVRRRAWLPSSRPSE